MAINYLTQTDYVGVDKDPMVTVAPGGTYSARVGLIRWSDYEIESPKLKWRFDATDIYGNKIDTGIFGETSVTYSPYTYETKNVSFSIPSGSRFAKVVGTFTVWIEDATGRTLAKNFSNFKVTDGKTTSGIDNFAQNSFALRQTVPTSNQFNNGVGALVYKYDVPASFDVEQLKNMRILAELSSIKAGTSQTSVGEEKPSDVTVSINGHEVDAIFIPDAPRDMRGTLSLDSGLPSAGAFGYLVNLNVNDDVIAAIKNDLATDRILTVSYEVKADAVNKNGVRAYNENIGRYAVSPMIILNPVEEFMASAINLTQELQEVYNAETNNYSIEANVSDNVTINAGYEVTVNGSLVNVLENGNIIASANAANSVSHVRVTFFDRQVRVYTNNDPEFLIDVYGDTFANTQVKVSGNGSLTNVVVTPETYDNSTVETTDVSIQYVESFEQSGKMNNWEFMGTQTSIGGDSLEGSFVYVNTNNNGHVRFETGGGHKLVNHNITASNFVIEGDFTITGQTANGANGNAGFIIRGSNYIEDIDGADGYYVGIGYDGGDGFRDGFVEAGRMHNGWTGLKKVPAPVAQNETVRLRVVAVGPRIMVYLNDEEKPYIDIYDSTYASGSIAIRGFRALGTVDNIVLSTAPRFTADFEDKTQATSNYVEARLDEWTVNGNWEIGNGILSVEDNATALVGSDVWSDYEVGVDLNSSNANSGIIFRAVQNARGLRGYYAALDSASRKIELVKVTDGEETVIDSADVNILPNSRVRVIAVNNSIKVYYGRSSQPVISVNDSTYSYGKVGLISKSGNTSFDNFKASDKFKFEENFADGALLGFDSVKGDWSISDNVLSIPFGSEDKLVDGYATMDDFQLDFEVKVNQTRLDGKSNAGVIFRGTDFSGANDGLRGYVLGINYNSNGSTNLEMCDLHYGWRPLPEVDVDLTLGEWYKISIRCEGDNIKVFFEDEETPRIDITDKQYSHGQIAFRNYYAGASYRNIVVTPLGASYEEKPAFDTNLSGWESKMGNWQLTDEGYEGNTIGSSDGFLISNESVAAGQSFTYEANFTLLEGPSAAIVFGAEDRNDPGRNWYALNINKNPEDDNTRIFSVGGDGFWDVAERLTDSERQLSNYTLKIVYDYPNRTLTSYLNGRETNKKTSYDFPGGYFGLLTWNTKALFHSAKLSKEELPNYQLVELPLGNANTPNDSSVTIKGENSYSLDRLRDRNNFVIFDAYTSAMEFEATMNITETGDASGFLYGVADKNNPGNNWSAIHISRIQNRLRIFNEVSWQTTEKILPNLSEKINLNEPIDLKVTIDLHGNMKIYGNTILLMETAIANYTGGYVGLITYNTAADFDNVKLKGVELPALDGLELIGAVLDEEFKPESFSYTASASKDAAFIRIRPTIQEGIVKVNGVEVNSGELSPEIKIGVGSNLISVLVMDEEQVLSRDIRITVNKEFNKDAPYDSPIRPQFHFTAQQWWLNDPNGLVYNSETGVYHMYYQYNPSVTYHDGRSHWGHATSTDLIHWTELPIALYPDDFGVIYSGSGAIDRNNTSGLFDDSIPPESRMVSMYTYHRSDGSEHQALAYSKDNGLTWTKYVTDDGKPAVIMNDNDKYGRDFRDPKIIWMEDTQRWLMVIAGGRARLFTSTNLIDWTENNALFNKDGSELHSECPELFPLKVDGDGDVKWVYSGSGDFYVIGDLVFENDKYNFVPETDRIPFYSSNPGGGMYAAQNFSNEPKDRIVMVSWMAGDEDVHNLRLYDKTWRSALSLPVELSLVTTVNGLRLATNPVEEYKSLRNEILYQTTNTVITPSTQNILGNLNETTYEIEAQIKPTATTTEFGFNLRTATNGQKMALKYNVASKALTLDTTNTGLANTGIKRATLNPLPDGSIKLSVLVDRSIIDIFANDGTEFIHNYFYTDINNSGLEFYTIGGNVEINSMVIHSLKSSWTSEPSPYPLAPVLMGLELSEGEINFSSAQREYTLNVDAAIDKIKVKPTFTHGEVSATVNSKAVNNASFSDDISLNTGENKIYVTLKDKVSENIYIITINRGDM